jgi:2-polyprenyl-6-methoxyphenol hydroxylase-like FAD-dependent oxidoreductase
VCGESLSALGVETLARHGVELGSLEPISLVRTVLHATDGRSVSLKLPRPMLGVTRRAFDAYLLRAAISAGVEVLQPARCEAIDAGRAAVTLRRLDGGGGGGVEVRRADVILLADGKGALLPHRPRPTKDFGIKAHFAGVPGPRDAVELFGVRGHYVGVAPVEGGLTNVAFSVPIARLKLFRDDLDALWRRLMLENFSLRERFGGAERVGDWLAAPLPRFPVARGWPGRVVPIGNAAAALEPIGGEGMGLAIRSAELAADGLDESWRAGRRVDADRLRADFGRLWRARRLAGRALARVLSRPAMAGAVLDWTATSEWLPRAAMRWMGKG